MGQFTPFTFHSVAPAYSNNVYDTWSCMMTIPHQMQYHRVPTECQILHHYELEYLLGFCITVSRVYCF